MGQAGDCLPLLMFPVGTTFLWGGFPMAAPLTDTIVCRGRFDL